MRRADGRMIVGHYYRMARFNSEFVYIKVIQAKHDWGCRGISMYQVKDSVSAELAAGWKTGWEMQKTEFGNCTHPDHYVNEIGCPFSMKYTECKAGGYTCLLKLYEFDVKKLFTEVTRLQGLLKVGV